VDVIEEVWLGSRSGWRAVGGEGFHLGAGAKRSALVDALALIGDPEDLADRHMSRAEQLADDVARSIAERADAAAWHAYAGTVRKGLPEEDYAGDDGKSFPIEDQADVEHAAMLLHHAPDPEKVRRRILEIVARKKLKPPAAWSTTKKAA
jgi:hypothetical protein